MASIIIYFSRADENYFGGKMQYITKGNTEIIAEMISEKTGAKLFKIEPEKPYAAEYAICIEEAKNDLRQNARPQIKDFPMDIEKYDIIYLGYPNYWGTMPMAVFTLLDGIDTAGKTIKPFCTHEGSGMGRSESDIKKLCPNAYVEKGLAVCGSEVGNAEQAVSRFVK